MHLGTRMLHVCSSFTTLNGTGLEAKRPSVGMHLFLFLHVFRPGSEVSVSNRAGGGGAGGEAVSGRKCVGRRLHCGAAVGGTRLPWYRFTLARVSRPSFPLWRLPVATCAICVVGYTLM